MIEENQDHEEHDDQDLPQDPEGESTADETDGGGDDGAGADMEQVIRIKGMYNEYFLDYASYVILERAVPHLHDGLKPVQRRILHSLKEMDDGRFHKVANAIGNTMKYHPHGDASIGDAMVQIGQRAIGSARPADAAAARAYGATFISARELARLGIDYALDAIPANTNIIINLDIDGMKPAEVPGVIGRAPGGLGYWEVVELIHGIASKSRIAGFNLLEFVPERDVDGLGANIAAHVVLNALAAIHREV